MGSTKSAVGVRWQRQSGEYNNSPEERSGTRTPGTVAASAAIAPAPAPNKPQGSSTRQADLKPPGVPNRALIGPTASGAGSARRGRCPSTVSQAHAWQGDLQCP